MRIQYYYSTTIHSKLDAFSHENNKYEKSEVKNNTISVKTLIVGKAYFLPIFVKKII